MTHTRAERGRLRPSSSSRECASPHGDISLSAAVRASRRVFVLWESSENFPITQKCEPSVKSQVRISLFYFSLFLSLPTAADWFYLYLLAAFRRDIALERAASFRWYS